MEEPRTNESADESTAVSAQAGTKAPSVVIPATAPALLGVSRSALATLMEQQEYVSRAVKRLVYPLPASALAQKAGTIEAVMARARAQTLDAVRDLDRWTSPGMGLLDIAELVSPGGSMFAEMQAAVAAISPQALLDRFAAESSSLPDLKRVAEVAAGLVSREAESHGLAKCMQSLRADFEAISAVRVSTPGDSIQVPGCSDLLGLGGSPEPQGPDDAPRDDARAGEAAPRHISVIRGGKSSLTDTIAYASPLQEESEAKVVEFLREERQRGFSAPGTSVSRVAMPWTWLVARAAVRGWSEEKLFAATLALIRDSRSRRPRRRYFDFGRPTRPDAQPMEPADHREVLIADERGSLRVTYQGQSGVYAKTKGMRMLQVLTNQPGTAIKVLALYTAINHPGADIAQSGPAVGVGGSGCEGMQEHDADVGRAPVADERALGDCQDRLVKISEELHKAHARADAEKIKNLEAERRAIQSYLPPPSRADRRPVERSRQEERARKNVERLIRRAIGVIEKHQPAAGRHLQAHVKTGYACIYVIPSTAAKLGRET